MAQLIIDSGTEPNDGTGDSLRSATFKINSNFNELYSYNEGFSNVSRTGDYVDLINRPDIPTTIRDLDDPFQDLEQVRGTITSSLVTDGGFYTIGQDQTPLRTIYVTELNAGNGVAYELNIIGNNGITIDSGTFNTNITSNVLNITTQAQLDINAQEVNIVGQVNANISGNVTANDGTSLINASTGEIVGPINTSSNAVFEGNVDLTNATVTGLPATFSGDYDDLINKPTLFSGSYNDLTDTPTLFSGSYNDLTDTPTIVDYSSDITTLQTGVQQLDTGLQNLTTSFSEVDTDSVPESTTPTNLYFTDARARAAISVTGDINYNSGTGVLSYTAPSIPTTVAELTDSSDYALQAALQSTESTLIAEDVNLQAQIDNLKSDIQTAAANAVDFADFQARIAAL